MRAEGLAGPSRWRRDAVNNVRLQLNPIACEGHGLCAELLPERIELDEWGYPIVDDAPLERSLHEHARRAVAACPTLALRLLVSGVPGSSAAPSGV
jgi:ferredoxin